MENIERKEMTDSEQCCEKWKRKQCGYDLSPQRFDSVEEDIKKLSDLWEKYCVRTDGKR